MSHGRMYYIEWTCFSSLVCSPDFVGHIGSMPILVLAGGSYQHWITNTYSGENLFNQCTPSQIHCYYVSHEARLWSFFQKWLWYRNSLSYCSISDAIHVQMCIQTLPDSADAVYSGVASPKKVGGPNHVSLLVSSKSYNILTWGTPSYM